MADKPVNLGGTIEGFPFVGQVEGSGNTPAVAPSPQEIFKNLGTGEYQGREPISIGSFYTGERFDTALPNTDTEEMAAQVQSNWDKLGNGVLKMSGSALSSFTAGTVGLLYGTGKALVDQRFSSLFDNELTRGLDQISKNLEDTLPNYYTHKEKDAEWWSPDNIMTTNFWADKVIKNIGFSLGAIAGGLAWGSVLKGIGLTNKLVKAGQSMELLTASEQIMTTVPRAQQWTAWQSTLNSLSKTIKGSVVSPLLKNSDRLIASTMGTFGEASIEALQSLNGFRDELIADYKSINGLNPEGTDLQEINNYADKVGNFVWGFNTLLLTGTNYVMLPKILGSSRKADKALINNIVKDAEDKFVAPRSFLAKAGTVGGLFFSKAESFEEGSQYAIEKGVNHYFNQGYKNREEIADFLTNISGAFKGTIDEGIARTFTDKEGLESLLIGGLTGAAMTARSNVSSISTKKKNTQAALNILNSEDSSIKRALKGLKDQMDYMGRGLGAQKLRQQAIAQNDILNEKDYELDYLMSYILPRIKYGKMEAIEQELGSYLEQASTQEGFDQLKAQGIVSENTDRAEFVVKLNEIKSIAEYSNSLYENISDKYSNVVDKEGNPVFSQDIIDKMVYSAAKVRDYDARILDVSMPLIAGGVDVQSILDGVIKNNTAPKKEIEAALAEINRKDTISEDELKDSLRDIVEMALRRKDFVNTYNNIKQFPQNYKQVEELITPKYKTEEGEESALEVGREYEFVTDRESLIRKRDDDQFEVIYPGKENQFFASKEEAEVAKAKFDEEIKDKQKVKIVATNPDGTVRIEDLNGDIYDILPKDLLYYTKVSTPQELLLKNKSDIDSDQNEITKDSGSTSTGDPTTDLQLVQTEDKKKDASYLFTSTTSISEDSAETLKPHHTRHIEFLNNAKNFKNRDKLRILLVSQNQESKLGLEGITVLSNNNQEGNYTDVNTGTVLAVYVQQDKNAVFFVDKEGKKLGKLGTSQDLSQVVFSTMPSTHLYWGDGKTARFREDQKDTAAVNSKRWEEKRKQVFSAENHGGVFKFNISRGIPIVNETGEEYSVSESLVPESVINTEEGLIQIPTVGIISHYGRALKFPNGRPVLQYQDTLQFLNNKNFTNSQVDTIYTVLEKISNTINMQSKMGEKIVIFKKYSTFLQNVLFYKLPTGTEISNNQMYIDTESMTLRLGKSTYDITAIAENKDAIIEQLKGVYHSVNNSTLTKKFNDQFIELYVEDGNIKERKWRNYQTYLLASKYPDKSNRPVKDIPLSTNVIPASEAVPYSYKQKYSVLEEVDLPEVAVKPTPTSVPKPVESSPVTNIGGYILDGKTKNTFKLKTGEVEFTAVIQDGLPIATTEVNDFIKNMLAEPAKITAITNELKRINKFDATKDDLPLILDYLDIQIEATLTPLLSQKNTRLEEEIKVEETPTEQKPVEVVVVNKTFKKAKKLPDTEYRIASVSQEERMTEQELAEFKKWHKENVPNIPFEVLNNIVLTNDNRKAWGVFENGVAKFYKHSAKGTEYHEIFEAIWGSFLTQEEQQLILDEFKSNVGTFLDRASQKRIEYSNATDLQAKERIADDFADFRLGKIKAKSLGERIVDFFRNIINFFKSFVQKPTLKDSLFDQIDKGRFRESIIESSNVDPQYSIIPGLSESQVNEFVQDITARAMDVIFGTDRNLYNIAELTAPEVFEPIRELYTDAGYIDNNDPEALSDTQFDALVNRTNEYLYSTFTIKFDEENQLTLNDEDKDQTLYAPEAFTVDFKKSSPYAVKILVGTLPNKNIQTSNGTIALLSFSRAFATLMDRLANNTGIDDFTKKLAELVKEDSNYAKLFKRLGGNIDTGEIDTSQFDYDKWRLFVQFYQTFSKQDPKAYIQYRTDESTYTAEANTFTSVRQLKYTWLSNTRLLAKQKGSLVSYNRSSKAYEVGNLSKYPVNTPENSERFLSAIGVQFEMPIIDRLNKKDLNTFTKAVNSIHSYLDKNKGIMSITGKNLTVDGPLTTLAELYTKATNPNQDLSYFGLDGKRRQKQTENNAASILENDFNSSDTLEELIEKRPELQDIFSTNSQILKKGGLFFDIDGNRIKEIKVSYIQGIEDEKSGKSITQSKLSEGDRFTVELNRNLKGTYYILLPADSSTEWEMELSNTVSYDNVQADSDWSNIYEIFQGYLRDDILLAKDNRSYLRNVGDKSKELRFFKDILPTSVLEGINERIDLPIEEIQLYIDKNIDKINTSITEYILNYNKSTLSILRNNNQVTEFDDNTYSYPNLDGDFALSAELNKYKLTEKELNDVIFYANINYIISNIELHKVLFGDPYQFAVDKKGRLDETKRIKSFLSPRKTLFDSKELNSFLNSKMNAVQGIELVEGTPGYHLHKSFTNTVTFKDIDVKGSISENTKMPKEIKEAYSNTNETDAFSIIMDNTFREMQIKDGAWSNEAEEFHQWHMAYARLHMPGYEYTSSKLQELDIKTVANPIPEHVIHVIKPIVTGSKYNKNYIDNVLDKMSQMPIYYHMVEGTDLENLYIQMFKQDIGYGVFESGRKVGIESTHSLYEDGSFNNNPFENIVQIPWKAYGVQQETSFDKPKQQTRGSQITKLISLDLFDNGVPTSERAKELYEKNVKILNAMNWNAYQNLLDDLGIEDEGGTFKLVDKVTVSQTLQRELLRREASENLKDTLKTDENGEFIIPFEASSAYTQIKDILYSMVDKAIISPKMNGSSYVQVPSSLWESSGKGRKVVEVNGKKVFTSSELKFYTEQDKYMEVYLPAWFKDQLPKNKFKTDEDLLNYLNKSEEGKEILKGIGFRIPTQSLSSIENIRVKGFLPSYMGTTVVVPSEITTKAGSDFDIDKLNMYLKAVFVDQNGNLRLIKYLGSEENTKEHYAKVFDKITENKIFKKYELVEAIQLLQLGKETALNLDSKGLIQKYASLLNDLVNSEDDLQERAQTLLADISRLSDDQIQAQEKESFIRKIYKGALENEYYKNLDQILSLPENFERLLTPVGKAGLDELASKLDQLKGRDENKAKNKILNRNYLTRLRHAFITGKKWVGIAAVNITGHSIAQKSELFIDTTKFSNLSAFDQKMLGDGNIVLPHNTTKEGAISMSGKTVKGGTEYISDRLSGYITSFVDIAKDPYILKVIQGELVIGTFMFLERIGAGENAALFMNQPIIEKYIQYLTSFDKKGLYNSDNIETIKKLFPTTKNALLDSSIDVSKFSDNIKTFAEKQKFESAVDNAIQHKILDEFLKYSKMAEYSFKLTQASNYDTARYRNQAQLYKKQELTVDARENNIFSSVDNLLDKTHVGEQATLLANSTEAIGEILKLDRFEFSDYLNPILKQFALKPYFSQDAYLNVSYKVVTSFLDFIIQTKTDPRLNRQIEELLVDIKTNVANQLLSAKKKYPNNRILKELEVINSTLPESAQSIKLNTNLKETYDQNLHIEMFRELKEMLPELYNNIVKISILQGTPQTAISFANVIPIEDRAAIITPIINTLEASEDLSAFHKGAFWRNNWKDSNIFHKMEPRFKYARVGNVPVDQHIAEDRYGAEIYQYQSMSFPTSGTAFKLIKSLGFKPSDRRILDLTDTYDSFHIQNDYILVPRVVTVKESTNDKVDIFKGTTITKGMFKEKSMKGDMSLKDVIGYQKVRDDLGNPVTYFDKKGNTHYIYKMINLWGDGMYASEYYGGPRQSVLNNGTIKIENEIPTADIIAFFEEKDNTVSEIKETNSNTDKPNCI